MLGTQEGDLPSDLAATAMYLSFLGPSLASHPAEDEFRGRDCYSARGGDKSCKSCACALSEISRNDDRLWRWGASRLLHGEAIFGAPSASPRLFFCRCRSASKISVHCMRMRASLSSLSFPLLLYISFSLSFDLSPSLYPSASATRLTLSDTVRMPGCAKHPLEQHCRHRYPKPVLLRE